MPELPEVETVKRGLEPAMVGQRIVKAHIRRAGLRYPFPKGMAERLSGKLVTGLRRRAKYILVSLESGEILLMHLGMSGSFTIFDGSEPQGKIPGQFYHERQAGKHDHVVFDMQDGTTIVYADPRRFGIMDMFSEDQEADQPLLASLGVEPMGNSLTADYLNEAFKGRRAPLKAALLDQKIIAGLGNIYVCEVLHRSGLSPRRAAHTITSKSGPTARLELLVRNVRDVLGEAIDAGGSSLKDFSQTDGELGYFQHSFRTYGREGSACLTQNCDGTVQRIVQSGRSTFFCPLCQS